MYTKSLLGFFGGLGGWSFIISTFKDMKACFQNMSPVASKLMVQEPKQTSDPDLKLENQAIPKFLYLKNWIL